MSGLIFISYKREDREAADAIRASLDAGGLTPWIDYRDIEIGMSYAESIAAAIGRASAAVLVLSESSAQSAHVEREVVAAAQRGIPVFVYREQEVEVPERLRISVTLPEPFRADLPREERVVAFTGDVVSAMRPRSSDAQHATSVEPRPVAVSFETIAYQLRRTAARHLRRSAGLAIAVLTICVIGDMVGFFEEWVPYADSWAAPIEDIDLEDYIAGTTIFYLATALFLAVVVRSWVLGIAVARALEGQAAADIIGMPVFSIRRPLQPRAAVTRLLTFERAGSMPWSVELWWPATLSAAVLSVTAIVLVTVSSTVPALLIVLFLGSSHLLALIAAGLLLRMAGMTHKTETPQILSARVVNTAGA